MSWRFRKSFSPLPGVRITLSPSGLSTSIGAGPFRLTAGPRGTALTGRIPSSGISYRHALGGSKAPNYPPQIHLSPGPDLDPSLTPPAITPSSPETREVKSGGAQMMTTSGLEEFKRLLSRSYEERDSIERDLASTRTEASEATKKYLAWRDGFALRRRMFKNKYAEIEHGAAELNAKVSELEEQRDLARIQMQVDAPATVLASFHRMCDDFEKLCESRRIWDTISERGVNRVVERTTAHSMIERRPVRFKRGLCDLIDSEWPVPHLENANGGDLYLFPTFLLYRVSATSFALLEYTEMQVSYRQQRFIEEEEVPKDSVVVDHTWAKANKDGSADRRFSNNYQIPVVQYGELKLNSATGLNEAYLVSSDERLRTFAASLDTLIATIRAVTFAS